MSARSGDVEPGYEGAAWEPALLEAVRGVRYGSVEVVIHDGRVMQIERREKVRFDAEGRQPDHRRRDDNQVRRAERATAGGGLEKKQ